MKDFPGRATQRGNQTTKRLLSTQLVILPPATSEQLEILFGLIFITN